MQTHYPLGFNDNIYQEGNISKTPIFDVFILFWNVRHKDRSHGKQKTAQFTAKFVLKKRINSLLNFFLFLQIIMVVMVYFHFQVICLF